MSLVAFHDSLVDQTIDLSDGAFRFYVDAVCWVARQKTSGHVSGSYARTRMGVSARKRGRRLDELVAAGLFEPDGDGWLVRGPWRITGQRDPIPDAVREAVLEEDDRKCRHCGTTEDLTLDHIYPRSRAGSDSRDNLQTLCGPCNSRKAARA